jgi:heterodisulfide reductase subunit B
MRYALFLGCNIPARLPEYETSAKFLLKELGVDFTEIEGFGCCGYPFKVIDLTTSLVLSAKNLALAERENRDILSLCQCCYGTLKKAKKMIDEDPSLRNRIKEFLKAEGLNYEGKVEVKHLLHVLYKDLDLERIREKVSNPLSHIKVATHYGCHALRPSSIVELDDPSNPRVLEELVTLTGAQSLLVNRRLECCGAPLLGTNDEVALNFTREKITDALKHEADHLCVACPYCKLQLENFQERLFGKRVLSTILITDLINMALGLQKTL